MQPIYKHTKSLLASLITDKLAFVNLHHCGCKQSSQMAVLEGAVGFWKNWF